MGSGGRYCAQIIVLIMIASDIGEINIISKSSRIVEGEGAIRTGAAKIDMTMIGKETSLHIETAITYNSTIVDDSTKTLYIFIMGN